MYILFVYKSDWQHEKGKENIFVTAVACSRRNTKKNEDKTEDYAMETICA